LSCEVVAEIDEMEDWCNATLWKDDDDHTHICCISKHGDDKLHQCYCSLTWQVGFVDK